MSIRISQVLLFFIFFGGLLAQPTQKILYDFNDFDKLHISGDFKVYYTQTAGEESMELKVSKHLIDKLKVYQENKVLHLSHKLTNNWSRSNVLIMHIKSPRTLEEIRISGDSKLFLKSPLQQDQLSLFISSDSEIQGSIDIGTLKFESNSDGVARLDGEVGTLVAQLNSDAYVDGFRLRVKELDVNLSSDAKVECTVTEKLKAVVTSNARLTYRGQPPVVDQQTNSSGRIRRLN